MTTIELYPRLRCKQRGYRAGRCLLHWAHDGQHIAHHDDGGVVAWGERNEQQLRDHWFEQRRLAELEARRKPSAAWGDPATLNV